MKHVLPALCLLWGCGSLEAPTAGSSGTATGTGSGTGAATGTATGSGTGAATGGTTSACAPYDEWDDETRYPADEGDRCDTAPMPFGPVDDSGAAPVLLRGNLHQAGDEDWYLIQALDQSGDVDRGWEDFHLQIRVTEGAGTVQIKVVRGDCAQVPDCEAEDEYSFFNEDTSPDPYGYYPADSRACDAPGGVLNECPNYTGEWWVQVTAVDGQEHCENYEIEVSNGVW